ncbi:TRAP transporter substrate-binding protein [Spiribacter halobius]|uniref:C4-dicarboxylate ABC transporter n=1 Tax=Sediminicurvatus halobius TaxID=2182432 RepID=A0A2U2N0A8_9GAMM|nr:TRAP transporter substrate-binding protein [Spiribacter halobius]PWG62394.1 C4-dicarboxylate ABC transporter [Spiribacter halobius]UEX79492.1 TRAP transporter substrate-binding protein [Spiribacter halobius]
MTETKDNGQVTNKTNQAEVTSKPTSRRNFLKGGLLAAGGAAAASTFPAPYVHAQQSPITLRMQTSWPSGDIWMDFAQQYVDRLEAMSGGRLRVELLPAGAVVQAFQVMDAVSDGVLDCAHTVAAYWYGKHRAASLFGTGPVWGWDGQSFLSWFYQGGGQELYHELAQDILGLNVYGFYAFPMPPQPFGWFKEPVTSVEELQGFKYRTVGLATNVMQALGMSVTQLPGGEIVPAMERGVIDAFEFNNPSSDLRFGAQDVAKHYILSSYHQANETFEIIFNRDVFDDLDDDLKAIVRHGAEAVSTANFASAMDNYSRDLQRLQEEHGVTLHRTSDEILQAELEAWSDVITELEEDDEFNKRVLDSQREWARRVSFYTIMNGVDQALAYEHFFPGRLKL